MRSFRQLQLLVIIVFGLASGGVIATQPANYWALWDKSNNRSYEHISHTELTFILGTYVITDHPSGINRFRYGGVSDQHNKRLKAYISSQQKIDPRDYSRAEQKAYWLNLYNATVINLVIDNYPVESIQDISAKVGTADAWDKAVLRVAGEKLSLNDIEHRILRPIWKDFKVHFGLACGSLGCPNIQPMAFTAANSKQLLKQAGREFLNHQRGLQLEKGKLQASRMFEWYGSDFAPDQKTLLKLFAHYADDRKALYLLGFSGDISYTHDWHVNAP